MNKIYLLTAAFAVMASLSGCSDTELASIDTAQEKTPIGFHTVGSQMGSRATIINSGDITSTDFNVFAFEKKADGKDGTFFMGNKTNDIGLGGVNISYTDEDKWHYTTGSDLKYWPTTPLNFYAVNPAKAANGSIPYHWEITADKKEITYNCFDETTTGKSNVDVMYAIAKDQTKSTNSGTVKLKFHHILSQVAFRAKTNSDGMQVDIKEIKINNFKAGGIFTLPDDAETKPTQMNWNLGDTYTSTFTLISKADNEPIVVNSTSTATDITIANPMLFAPQTLTAWNTTLHKKIGDADKSDESYLIISCKIKTNDLYNLGSDTEYKTLYVPFGADWQPGKRYVYTLVFGGGYDADGHAILQPINFEPSVEPWGNENKDVNIQPQQ